jgi:hypothetical protein
MSRFLVAHPGTPDTDQVERAIAPNSPPQPLPRPLTPKVRHAIATHKIIKQMRGPSLSALAHACASLTSTDGGLRYGGIAPGVDVNGPRLA